MITIKQLEINAKPKSIIIQHHSKNGNWRDFIKLDKSDSSYFTPDEVFRLWNSLGENFDDVEYKYRVIDAKTNKQLLNLQSIRYLSAIAQCIAVTVKLPNEKNVKLYGFNNKMMTPYREFQKVISRHGGIKQTKKYSVDEFDDGLDCFKLTFNDGVSVTVGLMHNEDGNLADLYGMCKK